MQTDSPDCPQLFHAWIELMSEMTAAAASADATDPLGAARRVRDAYFQVMSRQIDEYFRSPQFLESMKQSTEASVAFRKQTNGLLEQWQHNWGGVARPDLDSLMMAVRRSETRVLDKLEEISRRLDELERGRGKAGSEVGERSSKSK